MSRVSLVVLSVSLPQFRRSVNVGPSSASIVSLPAWPWRVSLPSLPSS